MLGGRAAYERLYRDQGLALTFQDTIISDDINDNTSYIDDETKGNKTKGNEERGREEERE